MSDLGDVVENLQGVLARLQRVDLWPPWDAVGTVTDAVRSALTVATEPPGPAPADLEDAAEGWHKIALHWEQAADDATTSRLETAEPGVWAGEAGEAFRASMRGLSSRFESVRDAAQAVDDALTDCQAPMSAARARYTTAYYQLAQDLHIDLGDVVTPWRAADKLRQIVAGIADTIRELIGAYQDADTAVDTCKTAVVAAVDTIELPTALVSGVGAVDQVNLLSQAGGSGDDVGPLRGSTAERAQAALDAMTPDQRAAAQALIDSAADPTARGWVLAAVASGLDGQALQRYATHLTTMTPAQLASLDPTTHLPAALPYDGVKGSLWQPDNTTCGSSSLVMARMLNDPAYAMSIITGYDPRTGTFSAELDKSLPGQLGDLERGAQMQRRFQQEVIAMHHQTNGLVDHSGGFNGWWPEALGTSPGAAARQMSGGDGLSGVPQASYGVQYVDPTDRASTYDDIVQAVDSGHAVPVYTWDINNGNGASGAHVTLVTGTQGDDLLVYEPGRGVVMTVVREQFTAAQLGDTVGWDRPMAAVLPR